LRLLLINGGLRDLDIFIDAGEAQSGRTKAGGLQELGAAEAPTELSL
jgi:hypothetical protein